MITAKAGTDPTGARAVDPAMGEAGIPPPG
jgi:hypothetical protein